jgi:cell division protein FtsL
MVLASFALVFGVAVLPDCRRSLALEQRLSAMRQANKQLSDHLCDLQHEKTALSKDPFYIEKLARRTMSMRRPNEVVYISLVKGVKQNDTLNVRPDNPPPTALTEVMGMLEPLATNGALRLLAVVLALANLLAAFLLFGRDDARKSVEPYPL